MNVGRALRVRVKKAPAVSKDYQLHSVVRVLALILIGAELFSSLQHGAPDAFEAILRMKRPLDGPDPAPPPAWVAQFLGAAMWALSLLVSAYLLSEVRKRNPRLYGIVVLVLSAAIGAYFGFKLHHQITVEQLAGIVGAALGAIDGWKSM